jgi:hypothetical protein
LCIGMKEGGKKGREGERHASARRQHRGINKKKRKRRKRKGRERTLRRRSSFGFGLSALAKTATRLHL